MFSTLPLALTFLFHLLHPTLAESAANVHVADILAVNEILEIQINHTIADVNAVLALNNTIIAPVRKEKKNTLASHDESITVDKLDQIPPPPPQNKNKKTQKK